MCVCVCVHVGGKRGSKAASCKQGYLDSMPQYRKPNAVAIMSDPDKIRGVSSGSALLSTMKYIHSTKKNDTIKK